MRRGHYYEAVALLIGAGAELDLRGIQTMKTGGVPSRKRVPIRA